METGKRRIIVWSALGGGTVLLLAMAATFLWYVRLPFRTIRRHRASYDKVERGMTVEEVLALMGKPTADSAVDPVGVIRAPCWEWEPLSDEAKTRIDRSLNYTTGTFFLPVTFAISFDRDGKVVGKHSYD
jgi:hypothetical protein